MIFKLQNSQFIYLTEHLKVENPDWFNKLKVVSKQGDRVQVETDEETAADVRDWADERAVQRGFDKDYNLNAEGMLLEDLVDILFVG